MQANPAQIMSKKQREARPTTSAIITREFNFDGVERVHGVTCAHGQVWLASGSQLLAFDKDTGEVNHTLDAASDAGTAFDGTHLFQLAADRINKIDPNTGEVVSSIPAPGGGCDSGMAWAEGSLWVGQYQSRKIHQVDPATGEVLRSLESDRFVTGVSWVDGELWHGTWEEDTSELRRLDAETGQVLERRLMPHGTIVSGLDADTQHFYCGGGSSGKVRVVSR